MQTLDYLLFLQKLEKQTARLLAKLKAKYPPDRYELWFLFDNSTIHTRKADDALLVQRMAMNPGGKQSSELRDTRFGDLEQSMVFEAGHCVLYDITVNTTVRDNGRVVMETRLDKSKVEQKVAKTKKVQVKKGTILEPNHAIVGEPKVRRF